MNIAILSTAAGIGIFHTAIGVDHYIPFVAMSKANKWNFFKTMIIVLICGIGHVLSSVILGLVGIFIGSQISFLTGIEDIRGNLATWLLIAFGLIYMLWGIRNAIKNKPHRHILSDGKEVWHDHNEHNHSENHNEESDHHHHHHHEEKGGVSRSFWPLFVLLVLGPCEPLIPLIMYPAAESSGILSTVAVALVFSVCTITTMLLCTAIVLKGVNMIPMNKIERYSHALAGFAVLMCGVAIMFLGI